MRILIVEDESAAFDILKTMLLSLDSTIQIVANTESIDQTISWLENNQAPDLIFMDIHLSDGSSFIIFDHIEIQIPIVFTTAYDQYALEAFKVNSIDYLLKPIKESELQRALTKFSKLSNLDMKTYIDRLTQLRIESKSYKDRLLVPLKDKLLPIALDEISYFYTSDKSTIICLSNGEQYPYSKTLEQIYTELNPQHFYRANKQFIIHRNSVKEITIWFDNRLLISLDNDVPERIYVSKNKAANFKAWVTND